MIDVPDPHERWLPGYRPRFKRSVEALPLERLRALIGQRLKSVWLLWDTADDSLFTDAPVVLDLGDVRLEVCVDYIDELSITEGTLDLGMDPLWCGDERSTLEWRRGFNTPVRRMTGRPLSAVRLLEYYDQLVDVTAPGAWLLVGVEFEFADRSLVVLNGVDENEVRFERPTGPEYRVAVELK